MIFTVDYHFHANLPRSNKRAFDKCANWWKALKNHNINTIVSTEHCYKNPKRAFEFMDSTRPDGFYVFPGMEYVTKEGVDIIIFSDSSSIYNHKELSPFRLNYDKTVDFILDNNLAGFIAHPYTIGNTSIISQLGKDKYVYYKDKLGSVEVANDILNNLEQLIYRLFLQNVCKWKIMRIDKTKKLPKEDYPNDINFLAAGSDAHHPEELGMCVEIDATPENLFEKITTNKKPVVINRRSVHTNYPLILKSGMTSFHEFIMKKLYPIFNTIDKDD